MKVELLGSILALCALPSLLVAQRVERFDELSMRLNLGDHVIVQTVSRQGVSGPVSALTRAGISVKTGDVSLTLSSADVLQVTRRRGHGRVGLLLGVGTVWAVGLASPCKEDCELIPMLLTPVGALLGAGIGALLPSKQVVYERTAASATAEESTRQPGPFDELALKVNLDDRVRVEDVSGQRTTGRLRRLSGSELTVEGDAGQRTFASSDVRELAVTRWSTGRGAGIGALAFLALAATCPSHCSFVASGLVGAGVGALVGAMVPHMATVYEAPAQRRAMILPMVQQGAAGARVSVAW